MQDKDSQVWYAISVSDRQGMSGLKRLNEPIRLPFPGHCGLLDVAKGMEIESEAGCGLVKVLNKGASGSEIVKLQDIERLDVVDMRCSQDRVHS
jgi:hypothetical protein